jgi:hypothetical protein
MGLAKELVAPLEARPRRRQESINGVGVRVSGIPHHGSRLISGLSYKTAFSNELLTSIFPL